jgi:hypothetical protein
MNIPPLKILIVGGYGTFGGCLARLLVDGETLTLLIAGRSLRKAQLFRDQLPPGAQRFAVRSDRDGDIERQLRRIQPDLLVDATDPFQSYGDDPYRVVKACIAARIDYMDLADGSDFVRGIVQFDPEAKARGIYVLSGVSSFPVLTVAVVRELAHGLRRVESIRGGIAPSPYAGVGLSVLRAIAGYSGKRIALVRHGRSGFGHALTETMRYTICPPGYLPLRKPTLLFGRRPRSAASSGLVAAARLGLDGRRSGSRSSAQMVERSVLAGAAAIASVALATGARVPLRQQCRALRRTQGRHVCVDRRYRCRREQDRTILASAGGG